MKTEYKVYEGNQVVLGHIRSIIYDLDRCKYYFIPNDAAKLLLQIRQGTIFDDTFEENKSAYIDFFLEKEIIFEVDSEEASMFPKLDLKWDKPNILNTISIEATYQTDFTYYIMVASKFGCKHLQIILLDIFDKIHIETLLIQFSTSHINTVEIIIEYNPNIDYTHLIFEDLHQLQPRLENIILYKAPENKVLYRYNANSKIVLISEPLQYKQIINAEYFTINITYFLESQKYNTFFNRRLFIDVNNLLYNSQNNTNSFGLLDIDTIETVIKSSDFQNLWISKKDDTDVCRNCEFRYMCYDNRVPSQRKDLSWFHQTECKYNPYIAKWKGEENYKTLSECGVISNMEGFLINEERINQINEELWSD